MNRLLKYSLLLVLLLTFTSTPTSANLSPVIETLDLMVDGAITTQFINQTPNTFSFIQRIIYGIHWENNAIDLDDFGNLEGGLVNGTKIFFDNLLLVTFFDIHDFAHVAYDLTIMTDDKNPVDNHLAVRLSFDKFIPGGLDVRANQNLTFSVQESINDTVVDDFEVTLEGYSAPVPTSNEPIVPIWSPASIWNAWAPSILPMAITGALLFAAGFSVYIIVRRVFGK